jgi:hypothetical protein
VQLTTTIYAEIIMANGIVAAAKVTEEARPGAKYQLGSRQRMAIRKRAPSWRHGPGASRISDALINRQLTAFLGVYGHPF